MCVCVCVRMCVFVCVCVRECVLGEEGKVGHVHVWVQISVSTQAWVGNELRQSVSCISYCPYIPLVSFLP